jgi:hypothetical protein
MRPTIRYVCTITHEEIESFHPQNPSNFETVVRMMIGPEGEQGEESFDISICTPDWLRDQCEQSGFFFPRRRLVVSHWNPDFVRQFISKRISTMTAESWKDLAAKISEFSNWEFEAYREAPTT